MTTTPNLGLTLPSFDTRTWHDDINGNFTLLDTWSATITTPANAVFGPGTVVSGHIVVFSGTDGQHIADGGALGNAASKNVGTSAGTVAAGDHTHTDLVAKATFPCVIALACSDEATALTTGTAKATFRMPHAMTLSSVRASLTTAQTSGSILTVDVNESGTSVLSTKLTIDNTEKTSTTAATAAVISDSALADDAEITIDIDQVGDGTAKGLKVYLIGTRSV